MEIQPGWAGPLLTAAICLGGMLIAWGALSARLTLIERKVDDGRRESKREFTAIWNKLSNVRERVAAATGHVNGGASDDPDSDGDK